MTELHLLAGNKLFDDYRAIFKKEIISEFNLYIDKLISSINPETKILFLSCFHRNTYTSSIFEKIEQLFIFKKFKNDFPNAIFYIYDQEIHQILQDKKYDKKIILRNKLNFNFLKKLRFITFLIFQKLFYFLLPDNKVVNSRNKIFLEIFENGNNDSDIGSHYYPNLSENINTSDGDSISFIIGLIQFNNPSHFFKLKNKITNSKFNCIFPDKEYGATTFFEYLNLCNRAYKSCLNAPFFLGYQTRKIIQAAILTEKFSRGSFNAFVRYMHFKRSNFYDQDSTLVVWNENHGFDKAASLALKDRKIKFKLVGHQGFPPSFEKNCDHASSIDVRNHLTPKKVFQMVVNKNFNGISYLQAPAFRFYKLYEEKEAESKDTSILIALPLTSDYLVIERLVDLSKRLKKNGFKIHFKLHPFQQSNHKSLVKKEFDVISSQDEYNKVLSSSLLLISSGLTNMYYESFFYGTSCINFIDSHHKSGHLLSGSGHYHETNDVNLIINKAKSASRISNDVIENYTNFFLKPNSDNIQNFLKRIRD